MQRVYIHAGLPKAGSTFLQTKIFPLFSREDMIFDPGEVRPILTEIAKEIVSNGSVTPGRLKQYESEVSRTLKNTPQQNILFSTEALLPFHCCGFDSIRLILETCKHILPQAELIVVLRNQCDWVCSAYSLWMRSGITMNFDRYCIREEQPVHRNISEQVNVVVRDIKFMRVDALLKEYYPDVHYIRFESMVSDEAYLRRRIKAILGISLPENLKMDKVNPSLDTDFLKCLSSIESVFWGTLTWNLKDLFPEYVRRGTRDRIRRSVLRRKAMLTMMLAKLLYKYAHTCKGISLMDELTRSDLEKYFDDDNRSFGEQIGYE